MSKQAPPAPGRQRLSASSIMLLGGLVLAVVIGLAVALTVFTSPGDSAAPAPGTGTAGLAADEAPYLGAPVADPATLVRPDSHRLGPPAGDRVQFVEFLDLECEGCRAAFPAVERLRTEYAGRVDFVIRYFPIPSHRSAEAAAFAVEAAGRQGKLEPMYQKMYETQTEWGEQRTAQAPVFRGFAAELGLDLARYDADIADPVLQQRVFADRDDGTRAGVKGTPTFFINGRPAENVSGYQALKTLLDQALAAP
ncbi:DsbA family protein [Actinomycetospora soli]|uniref:DsbA family protein n=1 Tax=Actinomycetospora soli TaxID=2893887 RepID=UPI001E3F11F2|nr:thioredoxin domain-containing protein [Actinomycetospora soli]MCD2191528.1 DsbA family protein [Actinomycetospora soli]